MLGRQLAWGLVLAVGGAVSAIEELRENLRDAARRDIEARRVRRRRTRRLGGALAAVLIGGAAAAGAADLISEGEPAPDTRQIAEAYKPPPGALRPTILATADVGDTLPVAVGSYDNAKGQRCLVVGSMRAGYVLGIVKDGTFHAYERRTGTCQFPRLGNLDALYYRGNTLVFGRAPAGRPRVTVTVDGETRPVRPLKDRAFLLAYKGQIPRRDIRVEFSR